MSAIKSLEKHAVSRVRQTGQIVEDQETNLITLKFVKTNFYQNLLNKKLEIRETFGKL